MGPVACLDGTTGNNSRNTSAFYNARLQRPENGVRPEDAERIGQLI